MKMPDARTQFITSMFLFAIALAAIIESPASAADPEFDYSSVDAPLSSTTVQELRQWASYYWEHEETGIWSPEAQAFEFTHPEEMPPGFVLFGDAIELFEDLYQDQLILEPGDHFYGIEQLIDDDPEVYEQFKLYTTTGLLMMGASSDPAARVRTQIAALEASAFGEFYEIGDLEYLDDYAVVTVDLRKKKEPNVAPSDPPPLPADLPPEIVNFDHWLKQYRERLKGKGFYLPDDYPTPGFDCDDYADASARWLQRRFSGATIQVIHTFWERPPGSGKKVGHVLILIKQGGYYWILDPQTGILLGPFTDDTPIDVSPILDPGYGVPPGTPVKVKGPYDPGYRGKGEPKPW